jgi:hypothetical protein
VRGTLELEDVADQGCGRYVPRKWCQALATRQDPPSVSRSRECSGHRCVRDKQQECVHVPYSEQRTTRARRAGIDVTPSTCTVDRSAVTMLCSWGGTSYSTHVVIQPEHALPCFVWFPPLHGCPGYSEHRRSKCSGYHLNANIQEIRCTYGLFVTPRRGMNYRGQHVQTVYRMLSLYSTSN